MSRKLAFLVGLISSAALGQVSFGPTLTGTTSVVNAGPGNQTDPHVSCDNVAYTSESAGTSEIRFHDLRTQSDAPIPNGGALDSLSDVSGSTIVFTRAIAGSSGIYVYDVSNPGAAPYEVDPQLGSARRGAAIGGQTVAWQDFSFGSSMVESEIVVHDLLSGASTRLTNDTALDRSPAVSSDGNVVVFEKCDATATSCDIYRSIRNGGLWSAPVALTGAPGEESLPDTNGTLAVYGSLRDSERDVFFQPVVGGVERRLVFPGEDTNPNISGNLIAFEHLDVGSFNRDLILFDTASNTAYRLTETASQDETLNDISVCSDGLVRVVYTVRQGTGTSANYNVFAFSFRISAPPPVCNNGTCANPGTRPLLSTVTTTRTTGAPNQTNTTFAATAGSGLLCLDNAGATSGWVKLNGATEFCPSNFQKSTGQLERAISLKSTNKLYTQIAGKPGTSYTVRVYGKDPACTGTVSQPLSMKSLRVGGADESKKLVLDGEAGTLLDNGEIHFNRHEPLPSPEELPASCSTTGGAGWTFVLLGVLAMWVVLGSSRTAVVRVRRSERSRNRRS